MHVRSLLRYFHLGKALALFIPVKSNLGESASLRPSSLIQTLGIQPFIIAEQLKQAPAEVSAFLSALQTFFYTTNDLLKPLNDWMFKSGPVHLG